jgi:threonine/homoserine/homoserine lactone efflux protein
VPETTALVSFMVLALVVIVVPGPSVVFVIGRAMILGTKGAVLSVLGNALGVGVQIVAVALGVGAVVSSSPVLFGIVKIVGAGFLIYLGIEGIRHRRVFATEHNTGGAVSTQRLMVDSSIVGITNAKTLVFFIASFPLFVDPARGSVVVQMLVLGGFFWVVGIASDLVWAVAAGSARAWLSRSASRLEWVRLGGGVALMGLGAYLGYYSLIDS